MTDPNPRFSNFRARDRHARLTEESSAESMEFAADVPKSSTRIGLHAIDAEKRFTSKPFEPRGLGSCSQANLFGIVIRISFAN
jgi:hypothetical protein